MVQLDMVVRILTVVGDVGSVGDAVGMSYMEVIVCCLCFLLFFLYICLCSVFFVCLWVEYGMLVIQQRKFYFIVFLYRFAGGYDLCIIL